MNTLKPFDLRERTFQFALAVLNWAEKCPRNFMTREMIRQVIDAGASVGANTEEAEFAASSRDQASKLGIALKEVAETTTGSGSSKRSTVSKKTRICSLKNK